ncbi:transcriptional Coactivator p15-domain-containing protein [Cunninghamella echinulata]|nr:transcriptional Coactivator p15-domain-containing protein [Cunninghamella echinulata]
MPKRTRESDSEEEADKEYKPTNSTNKDESSDDNEEIIDQPTSKKVKKEEGKAKQEVVEEGERNENGEEYFTLSAKRRITIRNFNGKKCVDLREYYSDKFGGWKPTSKGLLMPIDQFERFLEFVPQIQAALDRI